MKSSAITKSTGIVRRIDDLGRVVIPREFRKSLGIDIGDPIEIIASDNGDILLKQLPQSENMTKLARTFLEILSEMTAGEFAICSSKKWLVSSLRSANYVGDALSEKLLHSISTKRVTNLPVTDIGIDEPAANFPAKTAVVVPIIGQIHDFGAIVWFDAESINLDCIRFAAKVMSMLLQNY